MRLWSWTGTTRPGRIPRDSGCPGGHRIPRCHPRRVWQHPEGCLGPSGVWPRGWCRAGVVPGFFFSVFQPPGSDFCFLTARAARPNAPLCNGAILVWLRGPGTCPGAAENTRDQFPTPSPGARPDKAPECPPAPAGPRVTNTGDKAPVVPTLRGMRNLPKPLLAAPQVGGGSLHFGRRNPQGRTSSPQQRGESGGNYWEGQKHRGRLIKGLRRGREKFGDAGRT